MTTTPTPKYRMDDQGFDEVERPILLQHALWPERGMKCQSCGHGSKAYLQFYVLEHYIKEGRLFCYECAARVLADIYKVGIKLDFQLTTLAEIEMEMVAVRRAATASSYQNRKGA